MRETEIRGRNEGSEIRRERERGSEISMIKRENREREREKNFWKIGEERDIARLWKTRRQERFRGREDTLERDGIDRRKIIREK